jgi:hypothetical protein
MDFSPRCRDSESDERLVRRGQMQGVTAVAQRGRIENAERAWGIIPLFAQVLSCHRATSLSVYKLLDQKKLSLKFSVFFHLRIVELISYPFPN